MGAFKRTFSSFGNMQYMSAKTAFPDDHAYESAFRCEHLASSDMNFGVYVHVEMYIQQYLRRNARNVFVEMLRDGIPGLQDSYIGLCVPMEYCYEQLADIE